MMKHEQTSNRFAGKYNDHVKRKSKSIVNIFNRLKNSKTQKILIGRRNKKNVAISSARSNTSKITNRIEKMNECKNSITDEFDGKCYNDAIRKDEYKSSKVMENSRHSDSQLINQVFDVVTKKLIKQSKIPRRRKKICNTQKISQYYTRSVESLKKPILESLKNNEYTASKEILIDKIQSEKVEVELAVDTKRIPNNIELSLASQRSIDGSWHPSIVSNSMKFQTQLLERNRFITLTKSLSEDSTDRRCDWSESVTSEIDSSPSIQRKIFKTEMIFDTSNSVTKSYSNLTAKSLPKSVYSERVEYNFFDAFFDMLCWPLLFFQTNE